MAEAQASSPVSLATDLGRDLAAYRGGDRAALGRLVQRATPVLWQVSRAHGADPTTAEDATQNALIALVRRGETIEDPQAVLRWLVVTVRREVTRLQQATSRVELHADDLDDLADLDTTTPAPAGDPERSALLGERDGVLWQAVGRLSRRCQQLLRVIAFADKPDYTGLAQTLQMKRGSIGPTRARCLDKLRAELAADPRWEGP